MYPPQSKLERSLSRTLARGLAVVAPLAVLASLLDAGVVGGLRAFLALVGGMDLPWGLGRSSALVLWSGAMLLLVSLRFAVLWFRQLRTDSLTRWMESFLRIWLRVLVRRLPARFFHTSTAEESLRAADEASRNMVAAVDASAQVLQAALQLLVFLPLLLWISWPLTLGLLLGLLPLIAWMQSVLRRLGRRHESRLQAQGHYEQGFLEWVQLLRNWSLPQDLLRFERNLSRSVRGLWQENVFLGKRKAFFVLVADAVAAAAVIAVLAYCGILLLQGTMRGSDLVLFAAALILCYKPVKDCLRLVPLLKEAQAARRLLVQLDSDRNGRRMNEWITSNTPNAGVQIQNLSFAYLGLPSQVVFTNLALELSVRQPIWLKGANGCGKTTLLRLLAGLEIADLPCIQWPEGFAGAPHAFLSHRGVLPPLAYLREQLASTSLRSCQVRLLECLGVGAFLSRDGLSAGQRQRLGIAWLFCSDAKVLLFDEPFAFVSEGDRDPILSAMLDCAKEQERWFVLASNDPFPESLRGRLEIVSMDVLGQQ